MAANSIHIKRCDNDYVEHESEVSESDSDGTRGTGTSVERFLSRYDHIVRCGRKSIDPNVQISPLFLVIDEARAKSLRPHPGRVYLFKGGALEGFADFVQEDGTLDMTAVVCDPPGDFSRFGPVWHFTRDVTLAEQYAKHAKKRNPLLTCGVLMIAAPRHLVNDPYKVPDGEWRKLVWSSRGDDYGQAEKEIQKRYEEHPILVGGTCLLGPEAFSCLTTKWQIPKDDALQWVIADEHRMRKICDASKGHVWFKTMCCEILEGQPESTREISRL